MDKQQHLDGSRTTEPESPGDEFEPTVEMVLNDFDDERTLDEEEAMEETEEQKHELSDLEKEKDMPLDKLLAMYGYTDNGGVGEPEDVNSEQLDDDEEDRERPQTLLSELYKDHPAVSGTGTGQLRSGSRPHSEVEDDDDGDYSPTENDSKTTVMVGSDYQAVIPEGLRKYDNDALPYENEDKLLWDPATTNEDDLTNFMITVEPANNQGRGGIPKGSHVRDEDQTLFLPLQRGYNFDKVQRATNQNSSTYLSSEVVGQTNEWSEEECKNFETGLGFYGKDFYLIQKNMVPTRSVGELVQFYYLWKKTERHDIFAEKFKLEKKKYTLNPRTTLLKYRDFMDEFLDEEDNVGKSTSHVHSLLSSDSKRRPSPLPMTPDVGGSDSVTPDEVCVFKADGDGSLVPKI